MPIIRDIRGNEREVRAKRIEVDGIIYITTKETPEGEKARFLNAYEESTGHWVSCGKDIDDITTDIQRKSKHIKHILSAMKKGEK